MSARWRTRRWVVLGVYLLLATPLIMAAEDICLDARDTNGQEVNGGYTSPYHICAEAIEIVEYHHLAEIGQLGLTLEKVIFTKLVDDASVDFYRAWDRQEAFVEMKFFFASLQPSGKVEKTHTVTLANAVIEDIELLDMETSPDRPRASERVRVSFSSITIRDDLHNAEETLP